MKSMVKNVAAAVRAAKAGKGETSPAQEAKITVEGLPGNFGKRLSSLLTQMRNMRASQGRGLDKMPPGIAKKIAAGKAVPAGIARTRSSLLAAAKPAAPEEEEASTVKLKNGGSVRKYQMGGAVLPAQANARAGQAMADRRPLPSQAAGARPFKNGGAADKAGRALMKKSPSARGRAMKGR
jgi:hypothetical protein